MSVIFPDLKIYDDLIEEEKSNIEKREMWINSVMLTLTSRCRTSKKSNNLKFYFLTSFCCLKSFYESLQRFHKTFWDTTKKYENNIFILIQLSETHGKRRVKKQFWKRFSGKKYRTNYEFSENEIRKTNS